MSARAEYIEAYIHADMVDRFSPIMNAIYRLQGQDPFDDNLGPANFRIYLDSIHDVVSAEESIGDNAAKYTDDSLVGAVLRAVEKRLGKSADMHLHQWAGSTRN